MTRSLDNRGETEALAGAEVSPLGPPSGRSADILPFKPRVAAASVWLEEGSEDQWEDLGTLAVSLVADWQLPRLLVFSAPDAGEEEQHREL